MARVLRIDCYNHEYNLETIKTFGPARFGVLEHARHKTHKYAWFDERGIVTLGAGALAGTNIRRAQDAVFVLKEPSTNQLVCAHLPGFARALRAAQIDYVTFEKKSTRPVAIGVKLDGEFHVTFKTFSDPWFKRASRKSVGNARSRVERALRLFFRSTNGNGFTCGIGAYTGYGSVSSGQQTRRGGVGSVLKQAHNVIGAFFGGNHVDEPFNELTIKRVYDATQSFFDPKHSELSDEVDLSCAFNNAFEKVPNRISELGKNVSNFGAYTALLATNTEADVLSRVHAIALDELTVSRILGGLLHAYAHDCISREEFVRADVSVNAEEYARNPYYYAQEHARLYAHVLSAIQDQEAHGRIFSLPYKDARKEIARAFGKEATASFKQLPRMNFSDFVRGDGGLSIHHNLTSQTVSELAGIRVLRKIDLLEHALQTRALFEQYNQKT